MQSIVKTNWGAVLWGLAFSVPVALVLKWCVHRLGGTDISIIAFILLIGPFSSCRFQWKTPTRKLISTALWMGVFLSMILSTRR